MSNSPSNETIFALMNQGFLNMGEKLDAMNNHLEKLNGQTTENTQFRIQSRVWFSVAGFLIVSASGIVNVIIIKFIS